MIRFLKILGIILGVVVVLILIGAATIHFRGVPTYEPEKIDLDVAATPERLERGEALVSMVCAECHRSDKGVLEGKKVMDVPDAFGPVYSANITGHPREGIGGWSDGELYVFLKTGVKPNGNYAPPYMPKFPNISDEDLFSIIAFLRSDHPMVAESDKPTRPCEPSFLTKFLTNTVIKPNPLKRDLPRPDVSDQVAYGGYLVNNVLSCYVCHSQALETANELEPTKTPGYLAGGANLLNMKKEVVYGPNITMDPETGIGTWSEEDFIGAVMYGQRPNNLPAIQYPMLKLTALDTVEVKAIWAYLQTVEPVKNEVPKNY